MSTFLAMDGYGAFIWSAYGVSFLSIFVLILRLIGQRSTTLERLNKLTRTQTKP